MASLCKANSPLIINVVACGGNSAAKNFNEGLSQNATIGKS
jgi:hypothetical protein